MAVRPDLVLREEGRVIAVAGTKYKLLDYSGEMPNADLYQLVTYCVRFGLGVRHLIYASAEPPPDPV